MRAPSTAADRNGRKMSLAMRLMGRSASGVRSGCSRGKKAATTPTKAMRMTWATAPAAVPRTLKSCIAAASWSGASSS